MRTTWKKEYLYWVLFLFVFTYAQNEHKKNIF